MNMVEKVVKEIRKLEGCYVGCNHCKGVARAAIEAMKELTEEMLNAFGGHYGYTPSENRAKAFPIYRAIIEAALKE